MLEISMPIESSLETSILTSLIVGYFGTRFVFYTHAYKALLGILPTSRYYSTEKSFPASKLLEPLTSKLLAPYQ